MVWHVCPGCDGGLWVFEEDEYPDKCPDCYAEGGEWECDELHTLEQITDHYMGYPLVAASPSHIRSRPATARSIAWSRTRASSSSASSGNSIPSTAEV